MPNQLTGKLILYSSLARLGRFNTNLGTHVKLQLNFGSSLTSIEEMQGYFELCSPFCSIFRGQGKGHPVFIKTIPRGGCYGRHFFNIHCQYRIKVVLMLPILWPSKQVNSSEKSALRGGAAEHSSENSFDATAIDSAYTPHTRFARLSPSSLAPLNAYRRAGNSSRNLTEGTDLYVPSDNGPNAEV